LTTLSGVPANSTDLGTFTGTTISDNVTNKVAMQELETEVETKAADADLTAHTSATSGVHGVTGDVVGTTDAQDVSNKAIIDPSRLDVKKDTEANLVIYAGTATNGQLCFATDTKEMFQVIDSALQPVGSGGGAEVPSTYKLFNAEDEDVTGFTNISINSTSPLNGEFDYSVDSYPAAFPDVSTFPRNLGKKHTLTIQYSITSGTAKIAVGGGGMASAVEAEIDNTSKEVVIEYTPLTSADLTLDITDVSSATGLKLDDLEFSDAPARVKNFINISDWEDYTPTTQGFGSVTVMSASWRRVGDSIEVSVGFIAGTVDGSQAQVSLPNGLTIGKLPNNFNRTVGSAISENVSGTNFRTSVLGNSGNTFFNFGQRTNGASPTSVATGSAVAANSGSFSFKATVPIEGWVSQSEGTVYANQITSGELENNFSANIANNGSASITSQNQTFIDSIVRNSAGNVTVNFVPGFFTEIPSIELTATNSEFLNASVSSAGVTTSGFTCRLIDHTDGVSTDGNFSILASRQGSDYKDLVRDVTLILESDQEFSKTAYINVATAPQYYDAVVATTAYKTRTLNSVVGDTEIMSVNSNQLTLPKGKYLLEIPVSGFDGTQWVSLQVYSVTDAGVFETFTEVSYSDFAVTAYNNVKTTIDITEDKVFEFRTKADVATGNEFISRIKVTRVLKR